VLIFAPLSGHYATLLRDTVRTMLSHHDVTITDWKDARSVPFNEGAFHFDDYVAYVQEFVRFMQKQAGGNVHVISVCQPTVPVLAGISLMAAHGETLPKSMTMMGGPIDTQSNPTSVNDFATRRPLSWFEQHVIQRVPVKYPGAMRRVYPGFMQLTGFIAMNPERHLESHHDYYNHLVEGDGESAEAHRRFYDEYNAVMDLPAEYYLDTIVRVFQKQSLARGILDVAGERVTPAAIKKTALFTIEGELDDISGSGQTEAAHTLCTGLPAPRRQHYTAPGVGHYGIFSGRKYREMIYPKVREFIRKHN
jgi:poly(3-hydroxybutyrate) depolymerase